MEIREFGPDDAATVAEVVELENAVRKVDSPWQHPETVRTLTGRLRYGWDGEAPRCFVGRIGAHVVAASMLWTSEWDNRHLAWLDLAVHPDRRRQGHGSELLRLTVDEARRMGRTSVGIDGWDLPATHGFAGRHGLVEKSAAVNRRLYLDEVDPRAVATMHAAATAAASSYELLRLAGRTPEEMLDPVARMSAAINDAPTDALDIEDEVYSAERVASYERVTLAKGMRLYRILARDRGTGELVGHTVVAVEAERPGIGHQHDTSVVRAARGHRLGLLLKADMIRWLAEEEPGLGTVDTWNTESNRHMIAVNEALGYRVLGRAVQYQRDLPPSSSAAS